MRWTLAAAAVVCLHLPGAAQDNEKIALAQSYLSEGEQELALELFRELADEPASQSLVHRNYLDLLETMGKDEEAIDYLDQRLRTQPKNPYFRTEQAKLYRATGKDRKLERLLEDLQEDALENFERARLTGELLAQYGFIPQAKTIYLSYRSRSAPNIFAAELAVLYRREGDYAALAEELLRYMSQPGVQEDDAVALIEGVADEPELEQTFLREAQGTNGMAAQQLLYWLYLQQENYYGAFTQLRALERRRGGNGYSLLQLARTAEENGAVADAELIYEYVAEKMKGTRASHQARAQLLALQEERLLNDYPLDTEAIGVLAEQYRQLAAAPTFPVFSANAAIRQAYLYSAYLARPQEGIVLLDSVIKEVHQNAELLARAKLVLGDVYLMDDQPWESRLLYAQVDKANPESDLGLQAKYKGAKLAYYTGDFALAKDQLDILKLATSREIANDALALSILIGEVLAIDSSSKALEAYAAGDLLAFEHRYGEAVAQWAGLYLHVAGHALPRPSTWPAPHSVTAAAGPSGQLLVPYVLNTTASIYRQLEHWSEAQACYLRLHEDHGNSLFGDDALFYLGKLAEKEGRPEQAQEYYLELLRQMPGSVFGVQARKNLRALQVPSP